MSLKNGIGRLSGGTLALAILLAACGGAPTATSSAQSEVDKGLEAHVTGDYTTALVHYRQALVMDPSNKFAYYNIGLIDQLHGRLVDAENAYRAALNIDPNYVPALFNLAIVETQSDNFEEAAALYQRVVEIEPDRAGAHLNLGVTLARLGRTAEAEAALQRAIELDPNLAIPEGSPGAPTPAGT